MGSDFLPCDVRRECERIIPNIENVKAADAADTYPFLKAKGNKNDVQIAVI